MGYYMTGAGTEARAAARRPRPRGPCSTPRSPTATALSAPSARQASGELRRQRPKAPAASRWARRSTSRCRRAIRTCARSTSTSACSAVPRGRCRRCRPASSLATKVPGTRRAIGGALGKVVRGSTGGPAPEDRAKGGRTWWRSRTAAGGEPLASAHVAGADAYRFTGDMLAWGAETALDRRAARPRRARPGGGVRARRARARLRGGRHRARWLSSTPSRSAAATTRSSRRPTWRAPG